MHPAAFGVVEFERDPRSRGALSVRPDVDPAEEVLLVLGLPDPDSERAFSVQGKPDRLQQGRLAGSVAASEEDYWTAAFGNEVDGLTTLVKTEVLHGYGAQYHDGSPSSSASA